MRIVLFDALTERHLCDSLSSALRSLGHEVHATGPVWSQRGFPKHSRDWHEIDAALERVRAFDPDVLFSFRPSALDRQRVDALRTRGVRTVVWFSDDPILFRTCYRQVAGYYDLFLNCGGAPVLTLYEETFGRCFNFPFWAGEEDFPYLYDAGAADCDAVFFGNVSTATKRRRYEWLVALHPGVRVIGRVEPDPLGLCAGRFDDPRAAGRSVAMGRIAVNIPQFFGDYRHSRLDFDGLAELGAFETPSRLVQYAAWGVPAVTLGVAFPSDHMPNVPAFPEPRALRSEIEVLVADSARLTEMSLDMRKVFETNFTARSRARCLLALLSEEIAVNRLSLGDAEFLYREF